MSSLIDTHAHLDLPEFDVDRAAVLQRSRTAGVHATLLIGFDPERWRSTAALCASRPELVRAVGVHPNSAEQWNADVQADLEAELARGDAVAVGEIGLDYFRQHANPDQQRAAFATQLQLAQAAGLPIIIHQRQAEAELLETLTPFAPLRGVLHCFSGDADFAARCLELGLHLGVGGVATYPKSSAVREALAAAPLERLLLETDAPFLAPRSRRGKRNEPAYLLETLELIARERGVSADAIAHATTANALALFGARLAHALTAGQEHVT
jgi:TatD DNase family protein